jgi:DNA-binding response OmpR family regulator
VQRFVIIEDSPSMRAFITAVLEADGVDAIEEYASAMAAYRALVARPPRCVLLDVNLPNVSGLELIALLRRHESTRAVPVVMVTTESGVADRARAMDLGANAWLQKPFTPAQLLDAVRPFR